MTEVDPTKSISVSPTYDAQQVKEEPQSPERYGVDS
jgi:hypothetical protein